jgi:hypothetical protein
LQDGTPVTEQSPPAANAQTAQENPKAASN